MALRLVCTLLVCGAAFAAAQSQPTVADLPKSLQQLNARLAEKKVSISSLLASAEDYEYEGYGKKHSYKPKYEKKEYEPKYEKEYKPKYEKEYEPKYEKEYKPKYEKDEYEPKYEKEYKPKYAPKYEKEEEYKPKYEKEYEPEYKTEGYYPSKVTTKLFEKFRSPLRPQVGPAGVVNPNTFQFTSELTCTNPAAEYAPYHEEGVLAFPIVTERMALVTVGVCEWTVTLVQPQEISDTASLKGNTNVVCTFNEEAERHCKNGDLLEKGLTISGQGLVYNFATEPAPEPAPEPVPVVVVKPPYPAKAPYAKTEAVEAEQVPPPLDPGMDVYLTLINGVVNAGKHLDYDNGALQYFFGPPVLAARAGEAVARGVAAKGDVAGQYTIVFKK